jgi:hypothetical protein
VSPVEFSTFVCPSLVFGLSSFNICPSICIDLVLVSVFVHLYVLTYLVVICLDTLVISPLPLLQAIKEGDALELYDEGTRQYAE